MILEESFVNLNTKQDCKWNPQLGGVEVEEVEDEDHKSVFSLTTQEVISFCFLTLH